MRTGDSRMPIKDINLYSERTGHRRSVAVNEDRIACARYEEVYGLHMERSGQHQAKAVVTPINNPAPIQQEVRWGPQPICVLWMSEKK